MSRIARARRLRTMSAAVLAAAGVACAHPSQFERYIAGEQWSEAAREFDSDSSLLRNERSLYQAGLLYGTPGRATYNPERARGLLSTLLVRFPDTKYRSDAASRVALLDETLRAHRDAEAREHELSVRIARLELETRGLRARADSITAQGDSLRAVIGRLEAERHDREEQLRALRLELQQLKDIDLKPRRRPTAPIKP